MSHSIKNELTQALQLAQPSQPIQHQASQLLPRSLFPKVPQCIDSNSSLVELQVLQLRQRT